MRRVWRWSERRRARRTLLRLVGRALAAALFRLVPGRVTWAELRRGL